MEFTTGCLNVLTALQKPFSLPVFVSDKDTIYPKMHRNPKFAYANKIQTLKLKFKRPLKAKLIWKLVSYNMIMDIVLGLIQLCITFSGLKRDPNFEKLGYYALLLAIFGIGQSAYSTVEKQLEESIYLFNQRFLLVNHVVQLRKFVDVVRFVQNRNCLGELFIYGFASGFLAFPLVFSVIPLFRSYDPIQLILNWILSLFGGNETNFVIFLAVKTFSSFYFLVIVCYGGSIVMFVLILIITMLESYVKMSRDLTATGMNCVTRYQISTRFSKCIQNFRLLQLTITLGNLVISEFVAVLVGLGILAGSLGGFVMLVMFDAFPLIMYLSCSGIFFVAQIVNILLITLAGIPNKNGKRFRNYWKGRLKTGRENKMLRSCPEIGFSIGFIRNVKFCTALAISDTIINITASLALMKVNIRMR